MAQNISATNAFTTTYDTGVPEQTDNANIVQAFTEYHYGPDYNGTGSPGGIEGHLADISADIVTHASLSTSVHGVSGSVVGTTSTQTLTNKTLTYPVSTIEIQSSPVSYTLALADQSKMIELSSASATTVTIPLNSSVAFPIGTSIIILQAGSGQVTIAGVSGSVTVNSTPGLKTRAQWSMLTLIKRATNSWVVLGDSAA